MHMRLMSLFFISVVLSGCSILNPYKENFDCQAGKEGGGCFDVQTAYAHATATEGMDGHPGVPVPLNEKEAAYLANAGIDAGSPRKDYKDAVYTELKQIVEEKRTPMLTPPRILEVSFIPFEDEDGYLFTGGDAYIKVEEAKWILDGRLTNIIEN